MPTARIMICAALRPMVSRLEGRRKALSGEMRPKTMTMPRSAVPIQKAVDRVRRSKGVSDRASGSSSAGGASATSPTAGLGDAAHAAGHRRRPEHQADDLVHARVGRGQVGDDETMAHDRDPVGRGQHPRDVVADDEDRQPAPGCGLDGLVDHARLARPERGRRLVHDEPGRRPGRRAGDRQGLPLAAGELPHGRRDGLEADAQAVEGAARLAPPCAAVEHARAGPRGRPGRARDQGRSSRRPSGRAPGPGPGRRCTGPARERG